MSSRFNPPPGWPPPPVGWTPPAGWQPDPRWAPPPPGWRLWVEDPTSALPTSSSHQTSSQAASNFFSHAADTPVISGPVVTRAPSVGEPLAAPSVDNTFAWLLACAPISFILLDVLMLSAGLSPSGVVAFVIAVAINSWLGVLDIRRLAAVGIKVSPLLPMLVVPVYLIIRTVKAKSIWVIPVLWFVTILVYIGSANFISGTGGVQMSSDSVQTLIAASEHAAGSDVGAVSCPKNPIVPVGGTFECQGTGGAQLYNYTVTVRSADGHFSWR
jgi:Domain of unknown function (DUF4333)